MVLDIIRPGDKMDISLLHQNNGKVYKSSVFDFQDGSLMEIAMPTDGGKMVLFNLGLECQLFFYTSKGLYTCEAIVERRYKKGNFFLLGIRLSSSLKKYQRREFFRVECLIDFIYYSVPKSVLELKTDEECFKLITASEYAQKKKLGRTRDLSGGGIRFTAKEELETGSYILTAIHLANDKVDHMLYLVGEIMSCEPAPQSDDRWIVRAKWYLKDIKERDLIVRFVFEEDRRKRKKENG